MQAPNINIKNASLTYNNRIIFSQLSLTIPAEKIIALLGPSGVGKTSLLRLLAGLNHAATGDIVVDNNIPLTQQIAYMSQTDLLLPWMNVLNNAMLGATLRGDVSSFIKKKALSLLTEVGLSHAIYLYPSQLSGGMRQRVALVRTLMEDKPIVLMDEPFSALDAITRYKLQALASNLLKEKTVLFITHDPNEALRLADEIYVMKGQPVDIKLIASLPSAAPRDLTHPDIISLQATLFKALSEEETV